VTEEDYTQLGLTREIVRKYLGKIAFRRQAKLEQRGNFDEKFPEDVLTAFLVTGKQYFDKDIVIARKLELVGFRPFQKFGNGEALLFHPRIPGRRYVMGVDCITGKAIGEENTDNAAAVVLDLETGEEMAGYCAQVWPQDMAYDVADLGRYYNTAVIAVERTGEGGTCILVLQGELGYPSLYVHKEWTRRKQEKLKALEGFPTTPKTRPIALNFLNRFVMDHPDLIWDEQFLNEALVFVRDPRGIPKAATGARDDRVSARWIAHYARLVLLGYYNPLDEERGKVKYESADRLTTTGI
jgi:hypothetical protein